MTTFIIPDYTIGNSADCQVQAIGVLQGLDQALQSLQPAPNATTVQFNNTLKLVDASDNLIIDETSITHTNATTSFDISSNQIIKLTSPNIIDLYADPTGLLNPTTSGVNINSYNGLRVFSQSDASSTISNGFSIITTEINNPPTINTCNLSPNELYVDTGDSVAQTTAYSRLNSANLELNDETGGGANQSQVAITDRIFQYNRSGTKPSYFEFRYLSTPVFRMNINGINMGNVGTGVQLRSNLIQYPATYNTASATLTTTQNVSTSNAVQTFNATGLTATLPNASATNVGTQYVITNTFAGNLTITTTGGTQLIYSTIAPASATSRTLGQGHSQIFTAIQTTGATTYGWSMV